MNKIEYDLNPKFCINCNKEISYDQRYNKFCCKSCSCTFNNLKRGPQKETTKQKISLKLKGREVPEEKKEKTRGSKNGNYKGPKETICKICGSKFQQRSFGIKLTCSKDCSIVASIGIRIYQNGKRKIIWYNNKIQGKVLLESSWELKIAEILDLRNIEWIRPKPIKWFDKNNVSHLYFPDFYLTKQNMYLDPKNPYCMSKDIEKMFEVNKQVKIIYGDLIKIEEYIKSII